MKANKLLVSIIGLVILISIGAMVADDRAFADSTDKEAMDNPRIALFMVPDLSANLAKDISRALAGEPGLLAAKVDLEKGKYAVIYHPGETNPKKIQGIMQTIVREVKLEGDNLLQETSGNRDCSRCPGRKSCGKLKK